VRWILRGCEVDNADLISKLRDLRDTIDNIHMLAERFRCIHAVGKLKARYGLPSRDPDRERRGSGVCAISRRSANSIWTFAEKFLAFVIREVTVG
jgi:chorismate mutase